jgi:hypothetical protein
MSPHKITRLAALTRAAVVELFRKEREWRQFFRARCEEGVSLLWASSYQYRDELQKRGEWYECEEIGDVLLSLAREKLPESAARCVGVRSGLPGSLGKASRVSRHVTPNSPRTNGCA